MILPLPARLQPSSDGGERVRLISLAEVSIELFNPNRLRI